MGSKVCSSGASDEGVVTKQFRIENLLRFAMLNQAALKNNFILLFSNIHLGQRL
jgi:hypothetical protein